MLKLKLLVLSFLLLTGLSAIEKKKQTDYKVSFNTYYSTGDDLPFWLTSNRNGVFSLRNSTFQLLQAGFANDYETSRASRWDYTWGADFIYALAGKSDFQANQYWFGVRYTNFTIKAGAQSDPIRYSGLSSTNGNVDRSNNARPLPGISLSTDGFIPFLGKEWFSVSAEYEEKLFSDHTYVRNARLHHKSFYGKALLKKNLSLTIGLEHFVLWGGTSPDQSIGEMPGFSQYFKYVFGLKAGPGAHMADQINRAGNQLGLYSLQLQKEGANQRLEFYWNHFFEDRSGMEMANLRDGLWGLHLSRKDRSAFFTDFVYEYMYTLHQSGSTHMISANRPDDPNRLTGRGKDNYFDHYIYRSFTYYNRMMGTPLFVPHIGSNNQADGFESTRMWMHHFGAKGELKPGIKWKGMLTWSRNFGTYTDSFPWLDGPYAEPLDEFSFLCELNYSPCKLPMQLSGGFAGDYGERFEKRIGGYLGISYLF